MRGRDPSGKAIGVFDSGIGGLTVMRAVMAALPGEDIVYLGDTARVPYGIRSPETVRRYSLECTRFLLGRGIKFLVIACNTASALALDEIGANSPVPVLGVIGPGARAASEATKNKKVGVIGTEATVRSESYVGAISAIGKGVEVFSLACPLFVPLVEEGWLTGDVPELAAMKYLGPLKEKGIDTLVLGCTHYPLLKPVISKIMGPGVALIDSAEETAKEVRTKMGPEGAARSAELTGSAEKGPLREVYVTDSPERFRAVGERFLGRNVDNIMEVRLEEAD